MRHRFSPGNFLHGYHSVSPDARQPVLLGHRGLRRPHAPPENTFAAFDLALEHGCDGFEFDVRLTGDGQLVICHDPLYKGMEIERSSSQQLPGIVKLEDLLARYADRAFLDAELKVPGLEGKILSSLGQRRFSKGLIVSSFLPQVLREIGLRKKDLPLGFLAEQAETQSLWQELPVTYVIPQHSLVSARLIAEVHGAGRKLCAWTVNRKQDMLRLADWGADAIISDDPDLLVRTLSKVRG